MLAKNDRSEWPETFAELDFEIDDGLHLLGARVSENTARTQRARAELGAPVEPTDDFALRQEARDLIEEGLLTLVAVIRSLFRVEHARDVFGGVRRPEVTCLLRIRWLGRSRFVQQLMPHEHRRAKRAAGVSSCGLNPDVLEGTLAEELAVGHAIQRHAAGEHEIAFASLLVNMASHAEHALFGDALDAGGEVHVPLIERRLGLTRRSAEEAVEGLVRHREALAVIEILHVEPEAAVGLQVDEVLENLLSVNRPA